MTQAWYKVAEVGELPVGQVTTVTAGITAVCLIHAAEQGYTALDNRCPHQGGPLGEGQLDGAWLICPWHGYEYDPKTGSPPIGYGDHATALPLEIREDGIYVGVEEPEHQPGYERLAFRGSAGACKSWSCEHCCGPSLARKPERIDN